MPQTILFAGGGTGGHLTPGLAVAQELRSLETSVNIGFAGSDRPIDRLLLQNELRFPLPIVPAADLFRHPIRFLRGTSTAWKKANELLDQLTPTSVCGLGGIASVPVLLAAWKRGIPTAFLEQNAIPGKANRWLSHVVPTGLLTYPESARRLARRCQAIVVGNPVRSEFSRLIHAANSDEPLESRRSILVLGGSQGAQPLNRAISRLLLATETPLTHWNWQIQTGTETSPDFAQLLQTPTLTIESAPFFHDLASRLTQARFVISRAGATTLSELACAGVPSILVPYPQAADRHQLANARWFADRNAAIIVEQCAHPEEFEANLFQAVNKLLDNPQRLTDMGESMRMLATPEAAENVARHLLQLSRQ